MSPSCEPRRPQRAARFEGPLGSRPLPWPVSDQGLGKKVKDSQLFGKLLAAVFAALLGMFMACGRQRPGHARTTGPAGQAARSRGRQVRQVPRQGREVGAGAAGDVPELPHRRATRASWPPARPRSSRQPAREPSLRHRGRLRPVPPAARKVRQFLPRLPSTLRLQAEVAAPDSLAPGGVEGAVQQLRRGNPGPLGQTRLALVAPKRHA
jgi:hypothetical protein